MLTKYSAHPDLAVEQLQRAEQYSSSTAAHPHHRRHHSAGAGSTTTCSGSACGGASAKLKTTRKCAKLASNAQNVSAKKFGNPIEAPPTTQQQHRSLSSYLPARNAIANAELDTKFEDDEDFDDLAGAVVMDDVASSAHLNEAKALDDTNTKDCVDYKPSSPGRTARSVDEADHIQHRFDVTRSYSSRPQQGKHQQKPSVMDDYFIADPHASPIHAISDGCVSGLSSAISSPSASTVSSPLSTPTRLTPHSATPQLQQKQQQKHCCTKAAAASSASASQHLHHMHHHHHQHPAAASGGKKLQKFDPRLGPSRYRQLLPVMLCILSFAIVFSILIVYMDTTEIRHKQFRLNMSRDYDLFGVAQDNPKLIAFLREIHMRKYPMHFLKNAPDTTPASTSAALAAAQTSTHFNFSSHYEGLTPQMAHYVADLVGGKKNGAVIQSLPGKMGHLMTAPWLAETLNWAGVIVEPEPRRFFTIRKQNAQHPRLQVVHACVSPNPYPKEVTIHNEESEVRINSLLDEDTSWFNSRVKCFPLYSLMLACNRVEYDLLSLGVHGHELDVLQTLPFDKIQIEVISIHLPEDIVRGYVDMVTKFLAGKSYKLLKNFGRNYFYQRIKTSSRTRKKDILLFKTP